MRLAAGQQERGSLALFGRQIKTVHIFLEGIASSMPILYQGRQNFPLLREATKHFPP